MRIIKSIAKTFMGEGFTAEARLTSSRDIIDGHVQSLDVKIFETHDFFEKIKRYKSREELSFLLENSYFPLSRHEISGVERYYDDQGETTCIVICWVYDYRTSCGPAVTDAKKVCSFLSDKEA